jgi:1-acyl-sn-glycerol-3-phosphate acyltransferase
MQSRQLFHVFYGGRPERISFAEEIERRGVIANLPVALVQQSMSLKVSCLTILLLFFLSGVSAFHTSPLVVSTTITTSRESSRRSLVHLSAVVEETPKGRRQRIETSYQLSTDEIHPIVRLSKGEKEKVINAFGLWCIVVTLLTTPLWALSMTLLNFVNQNISPEFDPNRALYDKTGKIWAKAWLTLSNSYPTFSGEVDYLREEGKGPCLYVANHASWLDIPVLCTVLDPVFKFIAKGELANVPCIGQQLKGVSVLV